jgi:hypothetical protein
MTSKLSYIFTLVGVILVHFTYGEIFPCIEKGCKNKMKITTYGPVKNLSPLLKGKKGTIGKEKLHYYYT